MLMCREKIYLSATLSERPARRLRLMSLRPVRVFMRERKPIVRLRFTLLLRLGYAMPMGAVLCCSNVRHESLTALWRGIGRVEMIAA